MRDIPDKRHAGSKPQSTVVDGADARGEHKCTPIERQIELNGEDTRGRRHRAFQELPDPQGENDTAECAANGQEKGLGQ